MEIKLDSEAAASIASAAIFDSLSQNQRDEVIKQAVAYLLAPSEKNSYRPYGAKTPLQQAFEQALTVAAHKAVADAVENDPRVKEGIDKLLTPLITSAIEAESQTYNDSLADKVGEAVGSWLAQKARENHER